MSIVKSTIHYVICDICEMDFSGTYSSRDAAIKGGAPYEAGTLSHLCGECRSEHDSLAGPTRPSEWVLEMLNG